MFDVWLLIYLRDRDYVWNVQRQQHATATYGDRGVSESCCEPLCKQ